MREKIENWLHISCDEVDLTAISKLEFYIKQGQIFLSYTPQVNSVHEMLVHVPLEDAKQITPGRVKLQFAFTDATGNAHASDIATLTAGELLKEAGYGNTV